LAAAELPASRNSGSSGIGFTRPSRQIASQWSQSARSGSSLDPVVSPLSRLHLGNTRSSVEGAPYGLLFRGGLSPALLRPVLANRKAPQLAEVSERPAQRAEGF
jgi:hypothetical protein